MKTIKYIGTADVRELSAIDINVAFGIQTRDLRVDKRQDALVSVSNRLADKLLESMPNEWEFVSMGEHGEDDNEDAPADPMAGTGDSEADVARAQNQPAPPTADLVPPQEDKEAKAAPKPKKAAGKD